MREVHIVKMSANTSLLALGLAILTSLTAQAGCSSSDPGQSSTRPFVSIQRWRVSSAGQLAELDEAFAIGIVQQVPSYALYQDVPLGAWPDEGALPIARYPEGDASPRITTSPGQIGENFFWSNTALSSHSKPLSAYLATGPAPGTYLALRGQSGSCNPLDCKAELGTEASGRILVRLEDLGTADDEVLKVVNYVNDLMDKMRAAALAFGPAKDGGASDGLAHDAGPSPDGVRDVSTQPRPDGDPPPTIDSSAP